MYKKYNICNSYYLNSSIYINQEISTDIKSNVLYIEFQGKRFSKWISLRKDEPDDVFINPQFRLVLQLRYTIYVQSHGGMSVCNSMLKIWHCLMLCVLIFCTFVLACWRFHGFWKKRMFFVWKTRWTIPQESFLLNKSYFLFSWLTHFIRDEWVEFDSQTTVWPNVSAVIAITIRVCDFIKLLFALMYKCVCLGSAKKSL